MCRRRGTLLDALDARAREPLSDFRFWSFVLVSVGLVLVAGLMSGLTLALMSLDKLELEVRSASAEQPTPAERPSAQRYREARVTPPPVATAASQVLKRSGSEAEKERAERIMPVIERPHLLLVTLLVCNAAAAEVRTTACEAGSSMHTRALLELCSRRRGLGAAGRIFWPAMAMLERRLVAKWAPLGKRNSH